MVRDEIERNPNTTWARHSLATIYEQLGKYGEATEAWQSALNRMPDDEMAKVGIARIYVQQGRLDEAKKVVLGLDIESTECVNISLRIVEAYLKTGNVPEADVVMTRLLNSSLGFSLDAYIELASAYTKRSRPDRVREVLGAAKRVILNTQGSSPEWNLQAARLLWEATDYVVAARYARNALEEYKKQLEAYPFSQRVYEKAGFCYLLLGELASARESFQQFTSLATPDERRSVISELQEWIDGGIVLADASYILEKTLGLQSPATANPPPPVERVSTTPKDTIAPSIVIQQPKDTRGIKIVETQKYSVQVSGLAADEKGVSAVYVNGIVANLSNPTSAEISESGFSGKVVKFAADAMLAIGENTIEVRAVDVNGNQAKNVFKIQRTAKEEPVSTTPKDTIAPSIVIQQPKDTRGIKIVETQKYSVQVSGLAADEKGVSVVYVNGIVANLSNPTSAEISESGFSGKVVKFAADAMLAIGENTIEVRAVDVNGNQAKNVFKIQRTAKEEPVSTTPKDTIAPSIVIQQPKDTRGIKIVETQKYSVQVSGLAADENGVSVVYVNGIVANLSNPTSAEISESGFSGKVVKFAADAMLTIGENTIEVRAVDVNGNQAKNVFKIQRTAKEEPVSTTPKDTIAPSIVIQQPKDIRGIKIVETQKYSGTGIWSRCR